MPDTPEPDPELEDQLQQIIRRWHRLRWMAVAALALVVVVALVVGGALLARDEARLAASCDWYRDIGRAPVTVSPATGKPSQLAISLIVDARTAFRGEGCTGQVPPDPALSRWAAYYHLPAR